MGIMKRKIRYTLLIVLLLYSISFCYENNYFISNSLNTRAIAMGGAYTSIKDHIFALSYNPASFSLRPNRNGNKLYFFVNPSSLPVITSNYKKFNSFDIPLGLLINSIGIFYKKINVGMLIGDETITNINRFNNKKVTELSDYSINRKYSLCVSLELAPRVSVGIAGDGYYHEIDNTNVMKFGYRYGIWIKTLKKICFGVCFIDLPNTFSQDRLELDRFDDETLNVGFSYSPWDFFQIALDIRNVSENKKHATGEPHIGINLIPWKHLSVQGGFFKENNNTVISFGLGLLNEKFLLSEEKQLQYDEFILNAAVVWEKGLLTTDRWFMLSSVIRI